MVDGMLTSSYSLCLSLAKVQFATISLTCVKAIGQSNKLVPLCLSLSLRLLCCHVISSALNELVI